MNYRIVCISKSDRDNPHDAISQIGCIDASGKSVHFDLGTAIAMKRRGVSFFVQDDEKKEIKIIIGISWKGNEYIRTRPNDSTGDNLLSLPEC